MHAHTLLDRLGCLIWFEVVQVLYSPEPLSLSLSIFPFCPDVRCGGPDRGPAADVRDAVPCGVESDE